MNIIAKKDEKSKCKSYIKGHYKVLESQYEYISSLLLGLHNDNLKFVAHVISCQIFKYGEEGGYIPVPKNTYHHFCQQVDIKALVSLDIIEIKVLDTDNDFNTEQTYSKAHHVCREYKVKDSIIEGFIKFTDIDTKEYIKAPKVNLVNGKPCKIIEKSKLKDRSDNSYPKLIKEALKTITECMFELAPIEKHLKSLESNVWLAEIEFGVKSAEYMRAFGRWLNDKGCFLYLLNQEPKEIINGIYSFIPDYSVCSTGRINNRMQNASREMKKAAFNNIENLRNYDLRSSQVIGLIQQFKSAGLDTSWLENYKDNKLAKKNYADQIGIEVDVWKKCLCAVIMGGSVPRNEKSKGKVLEYLIEAAYGDPLLTLEYTSKFAEVIEPLSSALSKWHEWLLDFYVEKVGYYNGGKLYLKNATGVKLCISDLPNGKDIWARKAKVAAFVLQGQEAAFIHCLTALSLQYEYKVLQNEHDGLITIGEVPEEAIKLACISVGMTYASLELKSFS